MRRLLPLALLLVACGKSEPAPQASTATPPPSPKVKPEAGLTAEESTPEAVAKRMDVPLYPGAEAPTGMSLSPTTRPDGSVHYSLVLATKDSPAKAIAWYGKQLDLKPVEGNIVGMTKKGNNVIVNAAVEAERTLIRIKAISYPKPGS